MYQLKQSIWFSYLIIVIMFSSRFALRISRAHSNRLIGFRSKRLFATRGNADDSVFVVSSCSRGIGLEFTKQLLETRAGTVVGLCRPDSKQNEKLKGLLDNYGPRLQLREVDLEVQSSIDSVGESIAQEFGRVDMLLNIAGILGDGKSTPGPERSVLGIERDWLTKSMEVRLQHS